MNAVARRSTRASWILIASLFTASGALADNPTEEGTIERLRALGATFTGLDGDEGGTDRVTLTGTWTGTSADLVQLKHIRGIKEIWLTGTTFTELVLEDLPDLEEIRFSGYSVDQQVTPLVQFDRLPLSTIRLKNLPRLKSVDLNNGNDLNDTAVIKLELSKLDGLTSLQAKGSQLQDGLLQSVSGAPLLHRIETSPRDRHSRSQITDAGLKSMILLKELEVLDLGGARITDVGLKSIGLLTTLKSLSLNNTDITDKGIENLVTLPQLESLDVCETTITDGALKRIVASFPKLRYIGIAGTGVTASGLESVKSLTALNQVKLSPSQLNERSCAVLNSLPITVMTIERSSTKTAATLSGLPKLSILIVSQLDELTIVPGSLPELQYLLIQGTSKGATRALFEFLPHLQKLKSLMIQEGRIEQAGVAVNLPIYVDDELMGHVAKLKSLKLFNVAGSELRFGDTGLMSFTSLASIESVTIKGKTEITSDGISSFSNLMNLNSLRLDGKRITNDSLLHLRKLTQLRVLDLSGTTVDAEAAMRFKADYLQNTEITAGRID